MKVLAVVVVLVAAAGYPTQGAEISQLECQRYQETMAKTVRIREKCGLPAFVDCCQVRLALYLVAVTVTVILKQAYACRYWDATARKLALSSTEPPNLANLVTGNYSFL